MIIWDYWACYAAEKYYTTKIKETKTHPPPSITARLGNSSKLNASSEVIDNSYKIKGERKVKKKERRKCVSKSNITLTDYIN